MTEIVSGGGHPIMPAWSPDGRHVYFARADASGVFGLWRVNAGGGTPQQVQPVSWDWKTATAKLELTTTVRPDVPIPARVSVVSADGHPAFADGHQSWLDGQSGTVFTYSSGRVEFEMPAGEYRIEAARGFEHRPVRETQTYRANQRTFLSAGPSAPWRSRTRRLVFGRSPLSPQLRRTDPARARSAPADAARRRPRRGDAAVGQPAHAPHRRGLFQLDAQRAAGHSLRAGSAIALPRTHRTYRHQDALLAVVLGPRLSGLRARRSIEPRGAAEDAQRGRRELVRASGARSARRSEARRQPAFRSSSSRTRCSATSTPSSSRVCGATSSAPPTSGIACSTSASRWLHRPAPMRWSISSGRWRLARRACTCTCRSRSRSSAISPHSRPAAASSAPARCCSSRSTARRPATPSRRQAAPPRGRSPWHRRCRSSASKCWSTAKSCGTARASTSQARRRSRAP